MIHDVKLYISCSRLARTRSNRQHLIELGSSRPGATDTSISRRGAYKKYLPWSYPGMLCMWTGHGHRGVNYRIYVSGKTQTFGA